MHNIRGRNSSPLTVMIALSPYSTGNGVFVGYPMRIKSTQKKEMYMPNARNLHLGPNATYILLTRVGGFVTQHKRYQHVGIFALGDAKVPNANGFASQWNTGFRLSCILLQPRRKLYICRRAEAPAGHQKAFT